jgi:hypothetical protein
MSPERAAAIESGAKAVMPWLGQMLNQMYAIAGDHREEYM